MPSRFATALPLIAGLACSAATAHAAPPPTSFTYQGVLENAGDPVDGPTSIQYKLWDAATGGTQKGATLGSSSNVVDGVFNDTLDFGAAAYTDNQARWLEVIVEGQSMGRTPLNAAPYSLNTRGIIVDSSGRVGIGTSTPAHQLDLGTGRIGAQGFSGVNARFTDGGNDFQIGSDSLGMYFYDVNRAAYPLRLMENTGNVVLDGNVQGDVIVEGNVGVGRSPLDRLHVGGSLRVDEGMRLGPTGFGNVALNIDRPLDYGINLSQGDAGKPGGGSWANTSDERLKKNVVPIENALDTLLALRGVHFEYKDPKSIGELNGVRTGFIAQEVEHVIPDWVWEADDGYKRMTIRGFEAMAIEAMRELQAENNRLRERMEQLEQMVTIDGAGE